MQLHSPDKIKELFVVDGLYSAIIKTILYFDVFQYPLLKEEIHQFLPGKRADVKSVYRALDLLEAHEIIFRHGSFYTIQYKPEWIKKRMNGNDYARELWSRAMKKSVLISFFPFVRAVSVSGSMSKGYMDQDSDIDFFIITQPDRLWLCRTLLIIYKKIFLLNSKKNFCLNYFIDTDHLQIPDQNLFTASEFLTTIPTYNYPVFLDMAVSNKWAHDFLPNKQARENEWVVSGKKEILKRFAERIFTGKIGNLLESLCHAITLHYRKKKFSDLTNEEFELNMRSRKYASKHHPGGQQYRVMKALDKKCREFEARYELKLSGL